MPKKVLVSGQTKTMEITPLNSFNKIVSSFSPDANRFAIVDDASNTYTVNSVVWDGVTKTGTLEFSVPSGITSNASRTLTIKLDGNPLKMIPNPLEVTLAPGYSGYFSLIGAVAAIDFRMGTGTYSFYDYSSSNNEITASNGSSFSISSNHWEPYNYKKSNTGTSIQLNRRPFYTYDNVSNVTSWWTDSGAPVFNSSVLSKLCSMSSLTNIPIKTLSFALTIFYTGWGGYTIRQSVDILRMAVANTGATNGIEYILRLDYNSTADGHVWEWEYNPYLTLYHGTDGGAGAIWGSSFFGRRPSWDTMHTAKMISLVITPIDNSTYNLEIYINNVKKATISNLSITSITTNRSFFKLGQYGITFNRDTGVAFLEMAAYSDAKDSAFINQNMLNWGIS